MGRDEFEKGAGTTDLEAYKIWKSWPEERRQMRTASAAEFYHDGDAAVWGIGR